jgi:hypothetical protein
MTEAQDNSRAPIPVLDYAGPPLPVSVESESTLLRDVQALPEGIRLTLPPPNRWQLAESKLPGHSLRWTRRQYIFYKTVLVLPVALLGLMAMETGQIILCMIWVPFVPLLLGMFVWEYAIANRQVGEAAILKASRTGLVLELDGTAHAWRWSGDVIDQVAARQPSVLSRNLDGHLFIVLSSGEKVHLPVFGDPATCQAIAAILTRGLRGELAVAKSPPRAK